MKYLIVLILLIGCKHPSIIKTEKLAVNKEDSLKILKYERYALNDIQIYIIENHSYIGRYNTSLIHSESCKCKYKLK